MSTIKAQLDAWAAKAVGRTETVLRMAVDEMVEDMQETTSQGGRMRVDTGFLRNSITAGVGVIPSGPSDARVDEQGASHNVFITINAWDGKQPLYIGYSANYAAHRELYDGFIEGAVQRWPEFVDDALTKAKREIL